MAKSQFKEHLRREGGVRGEILFFVVSDTEFYALSCGVIQISLFGLLFPTKAIFLRGGGDFQCILPVFEARGPVKQNFAFSDDFLNVKCYEMVKTVKNNRNRLIQAKAKG